MFEAPDELAHHRLGNLILLAGKGVSVRDQVDEKDFPMALPEALQQMVPVELPAFAAQQMVDIRAVEPLALLDESLLPDHLFRRHDQRLEPEHGARGGPAAPLLVHRCDAVPGGEDQVDEPGARIRLRQPDLVRHLRAVAGARENVEGARHLVLAQEEVEILGVAPDSRMRSQRVGTADHGLESLLL